jgi:ligand-binding sensor domain-containing protein
MILHSTIKHFLILVVLLVTVPVAAQQPAFKCTRLTNVDGLSDNMVFCALQDRHGFMWFGTRDGLNKYDGYKFTVYRHNATDPSSLSDGGVYTLFEDSGGNLWVGTHTGGLNRFDRETGRFIRYGFSSGESIGQISSICDDIQGNIWFTTSPPITRLYKLLFPSGTIVNYEHSDDDPWSINSPLINYVCRDSTGKMWVTTHLGFNQYDYQRDGFINHQNNPAYRHRLGSSNSLRANKNNSFWICDTTDRVVYVSYTGNGFTYKTIFPNTASRLPGNNGRCILPDRSGSIWFATVGNGIARIDTVLGQYTSLPQQENAYYNIPSKRIFDLYEDRSQNIWVCTDAGIGKLSRQTQYFHHFDDQSGLSHRDVRSITRDYRGALLVGTAGGGLDRILDNSLQQITPIAPYTQSFRARTINTIYSDKRHTLWLGTNTGLYTMGQGAGRYHLSPMGLYGQRIWSMLEDSNGNFWVGTLHGGLICINRGKVVYYLRRKDNLNPYAHTSVFSLLETPDGILWIGTNDGLYKFNTHTSEWKHWLYKADNAPGLTNNDVWCIHESRDGTIWLGTSGGGLNALNPRTGSFTHFTEDDGLPSNIICAILEDDHQNLWVSTNKGLARFNIRSKNITSFGIGDGLFISEFHFKTCFRDTDGTMYFGGVGGYIHFHPDSISNNSNAPQMAFTSFKVFDRELATDTAIAYKREIKLDHTSNYFTVEFTALDFSNPVKNHYRYRLMEFDDHWRETDGSRPYASYTNIPPGEYVLWVQGSNSDGVWNSAGVSLFIVVQPAWWQTWWFRVAAAFGVVVLVVSFTWWRYRSLKQRNEVERRLVESQLQALRSQMNPHFIFNSLNSILHFITTNDPETAHVYLSKFSKLIRAILEDSRSEFISLEEEVRVLGLYLELEALRFDNQFSYEIIVDPDIDLQTQQIPPMLLQPHVENAIKHGLIHTVPDGRLEISIRRQGDIIVCSVSDNGIGRERSQALKQQSLYKHVSQGIGLTKDRIAILNSIHSEHYGVEINDLTNGNGTSSGTRVDIRISSFSQEPE